MYEEYFASIIFLEKQIMEMFAVYEHKVAYKYNGLIDLMEGDAVF